MINFLNMILLAFIPYFKISDLVEIRMDSALFSNQNMASYNPIKKNSAVKGAL